MIKYIEDLEKYGVVKISNYLAKNELFFLNNEYNKLMDSSNSLHGLSYTPYSNGKCARITSSEFSFNDYPMMRQVFFSKYFRELSEVYLNSKNINLNGQIFVVNDIEGTRHIANDLHYDVTKTFKFFIYLTDTTSENGAFTCVPGSHKKTAEYRNDPNIKISYENRDVTRKLDMHLFDEPIPIEGKAGTLIIFDTDTWHKAGIVTKGERRVMRGHTRIYKQKEKNNQSLFKRIISKIKS